MLASLPSELIQHVLFLIVAQDPTASLAVLSPFLTVSHSLSAAARASSLHARIFRLKFDAAAVERRCFRPTPADLKSQLHWSCRILAQVRMGVPTPADRKSQLERGRTHALTADEYDMEDTLLGVFLLMLDNDGRNFAQLEAAGVHSYLDAFVHTYLWEDAPQNGGWPVEAHSSACALWLLWLTMDRNRILASDPAKRERLIILINPFVYLAHKYPSSEAPPNHFDLPLGDNTIFTYPLPNTTTSSFYPGRQADHSGQHYPHYLPRRNYVVQYFRASSDITLPLASTAAKLLLVAYRELRPFVVPSHLPLNAEAARRRWWANIQDANVIANLVAQGMDQEQATVQVQAQAAHPDHLPPVPAHVTPPVDLGPTQEDYHRLNRDRAAVLPLGARWDWETGQPTAVNNEERENVNDNAIAEGESRRWDTLWWRMRLCGDYRNPQPSFAPGAVFDRGSMRGTWKGKIYMPDRALLGRHIHLNPPYPGLPDTNSSEFSDRSLGVIMQLVFLQIEEHVRVCGCPRRRVKHQCGSIPVPLPVSVNWRGVPFDGVNPQDLPAGHPQHAPLPPVDAGAEEGDSSALGPIPAPFKFDLSMSNAWLPGGIGGFSFISRPAARPAGSLSPIIDDDLRQRNELVVSVLPTPPPVALQAMCPAFLPEGVSPHQPVPGHYLYETYDPSRVSLHDIQHEAASYKGPSTSWPTGYSNVSLLLDNSPPNVHGERCNPNCARCMTRDQARIKMRKQIAVDTRKALEDRAVRAQWRETVKEGNKLLEEAMSVWGSSTGSTPPSDVSIQTLDVRGLGLRLDGEVGKDGYEGEEDEEEEESLEGIFGSPGASGHWVDEGKTPSYIPGTRPDYARERVTSILAPCAHAADTLFTGETPDSELVWSQKYTTYGRLRPWDGLVGLVRIGRIPLNFTFIFGYVVGGRSFVGEWRMAATDPMRPALGGMLVMSRVPDGQE